VAEVGATLGGRNDLIQFFHDGRRTVFEFFATRSQVSEDLRLLEQCQADARIAILIDNEIDPRVSTEFFRKRPDHFPFLWLRQLLQPQWEDYVVVLLRELADENSSIQRIRRLLSSTKGSSVDGVLTTILDRLEGHLLNKRHDVSERRLNGYQCAALLVIREIRELGVPVDKLRALYLWLSDSIEYAFEIVACGLHPFLITDLKGQHAIWSVGDLADSVLMAPAQRVSADILVDLHPIINRVRVACGLKSKEVTWSFFHAYAETMEKTASGVQSRREDRGNAPSV